MKTISITLIAALALGAHANICGKKGYFEGKDAYYYEDASKQGSLQACGKQCLSDKHCKSFAYNKSTCMLWDQSLKGHFEEDSESKETFYDRECIGIASSTRKAHTKPTASHRKHTGTASHGLKKTSTSRSTKTSTSTKTTTTAKPVTRTSTTLTTSTKSAASASTPVVPAGCTSIPKAMVLNSFNWFNSTHNLDCAASRPDVGDGTGCLDENGQWCDPNTVKGCTHCGIGVCMTGLPPQPVGYGPPDVVKFGFADGTNCQQGNPQGFKNFEVGEGHAQCGPGSWPSMGFTANSEAAKSSGDVSFSNIYYCNDKDGNSKSYIASYSTKFSIDCAHDAGHNATCTTPEKEVRLPLTSLELLN